MRLIDADAVVEAIKDEITEAKGIDADPNFTAGLKLGLAYINTAPTVIEVVTEKMEFYAIRNKHTGRWVYGTDYRYHPHRQRTSDNQFIVYPTLEAAKQDFEFRRCGKDYQICKLWAEVDSVC